MTNPVPDGFEPVTLTFPPPAVMNARGYVDPSCATHAQYVGALRRTVVDDGR